MKIFIKILEYIMSLIMYLICFIILLIITPMVIIKFLWDSVFKIGKAIQNN